MAQNAKDKDTTYDNQRKKIEKLMDNPAKVLDFPETSMSIKRKYEPPDFVRNVMGSSAGAGSGEFHVYRHLRRKEISRIKEIEEMAISDRLDAEYRARLVAEKQKAEEIARKKKLKRDRKKSKSKIANKESELTH